MKTFRAYNRSEHAYLDAGFLCSMGLHAVVIDERAVGGNALAAGSQAIRIEMDHEEHDEASRLLADRDATPSSVQAPAASAPMPRSLLPLLKSCLFIDLAAQLWFIRQAIFDDYPQIPPAVVEYLESQAFSDLLWAFSWMGYWPLTILCMAAAVLCLRDSYLGRDLFVVSIVWGILTHLGPPPSLLGPVNGFIGGIQGTAAVIALSLMLWSPLKDRFQRKAGGTTL